MTKIKIIKALAGGGLCISCEDRGHCPMKEMLPIHWGHQDHYGDHYEADAPDVWDKYAIDDPELDDNGDVEWCPMYFKVEEPWDDECGEEEPLLCQTCLPKWHADEPMDDDCVACEILRNSKGAV